MKRLKIWYCRLSLAFVPFFFIFALQMLILPLYYGFTPKIKNLLLSVLSYFRLLLFHFYFSNTDSASQLLFPVARSKITNEKEKISRKNQAIEDLI